MKKLVVGMVLLVLIAVGIASIEIFSAAPKSNLNHGTLDMQEWMLARSAAKREVARMMRETRAQPEINIISRPRDGQLFLISNYSQEKLSRRYLLWSWAHLAIFFGALGGIGWVLQAADF